MVVVPKKEIDHSSARKRPGCPSFTVWLLWPTHNLLACHAKGRYKQFPTQAHQRKSSAFGEPALTWNFFAVSSLRLNGGRPQPGGPGLTRGKSSFVPYRNNGHSALFKTRSEIPRFPQSDQRCLVMTFLSGCDNLISSLRRLSQIRAQTTAR